jgi:amino acid adenylation domain-containing protein
MTRGVLHELLGESAQRFGDQIAVVDGTRAVGYGQLDAHANQIAHALRDVGVGNGDRVALYMDKSVESIAAIYGILKSGAAYVPLDPQSPPARLAYILGDCKVKCLVSGQSKKRWWKEIFDGGAEPVVLLAIDGTSGDLPPSSELPHCVSADAIKTYPATPADVTASPEDLAYILYTSGSTGNPKGVMLTHRNAMAFVDWAQQTFSVNSDDRVSSHAPFHFDLSVFDLYVSAAAGAAVVLVPAGTSVFPIEVHHFMDDARISVWYSVPSILSMLATRGGLEPGDLPCLRLVLFAGEVFPTKFLRRLMSLLPHARFTNLFGPTETNVCTWYDVPPLDPEQDDPISIGRAIDGVDVFAVGFDGELASSGGTGELYVSGPTVASGYWSDLERTASSFVPDPRSGHSRICYRTGDLVQPLPDGNFRFLGRLDAQVKSRGYRIELGDIEAAILAHHEVVECAVVAVPDEMITSRLHCFCVIKEDTNEAELVRFCRDRLPRYMVPESFTVVAELPRTSTGKIDRTSLFSRAAST